MERIRLVRYTTNENDTLGILYHKGTHLCYTLEDPIRYQKIARRTCIPEGIYRIELRTVGGHHQKYKKRFPELHAGMLWLQDVPNFQYILIHIGNTNQDTDGCILLGDGIEIESDKPAILLNSTRAYKKVYTRVLELMKNGGKLEIEILNKTGP